MYRLPGGYRDYQTSAERVEMPPPVTGLSIIVLYYYNNNIVIC